MADQLTVVVGDGQLVGPAVTIVVRVVLVLLDAVADRGQHRGLGVTIVVQVDLDPAGVVLDAIDVHLHLGSRVRELPGRLLVRRGVVRGLAVGRLVVGGGVLGRDVVGGRHYVGRVVRSAVQQTRAQRAGVAQTAVVVVAGQLHRAVLIHVVEARAQLVHCATSGS